jgi:hypothetical protein
MSELARYGAFLLIYVFVSASSHGHSVREAKSFVSEFPREKLIYPFTHSDRTGWHYVPKTRTGISYKEMTETQKVKADGFLKSWLSDSGWTKLKQIVALESVLGGGLFSSYDPARYFFAFFGEPNRDPWTFRFEGHHISLNFTKVGDSESLTPFFWGANPARHNANGKTIEPMHEEQHLGLKLISSLSNDQKKIAIISKDPLAEVLLTPNEDVRPLTPKGIAYTALGVPQQKMLLALVQVYLENFEASMRKRYVDSVLRSPSSLHFAWAGGTEVGRGHYYRIQNDSFVVEYDNTQDGANHIHTVWHDLKDDFGKDLLRAHYKEKH